MLSNQENWMAVLLERLLLDRDDKACAFPPAERVIRLPEVEAILVEAISAAYRKGQEDMCERAAQAGPDAHQVELDPSRLLARIATTAPSIAWDVASLETNEPEAGNRDRDGSAFLEEQ